ncbi:MAG TPA: carboxypeptidase regulatory-like domain-containing protein, partial [Pyrinomonadaceae bacterium]
VYAATNLGVYRSTDGGASWQLGGQVRPSTAPNSTRTVVVDPSTPSTVYAGTSGSGIYKSTDGGLVFEAKSSGLISPIVNSLAVNPAEPSTLYAGTSFGIFKTTNGGENWAEVRGGISGASPNVTKVVVDPSHPSTVYAATNRGLFKSVDGGTNWAPSNNGLSPFGITPQPRSLALDPTNSATIYASVSSLGGGVYKTTDGGANWTNSSTGLTANVNGLTVTPVVNALLVDPASPSTVYAATNAFGIFKSTDGGANWAASNGGLANRNILALAARAGGPPAVLAGALVGGDPFVMKLNPAGTVPEYLRMLGGSENDDARGVALGPGGSAYVVGTTASADFPAVNARQPALAGSSDAYVVKLDAGGNTSYSTYLGGSNTELGTAVAVGADGSGYVVGGTGSNDFPVANALKSTISQPDTLDAFVTKLSPDGQALTYSTYLGGATLDHAFGVAVGADGSAHVVGLTGSQDFPLAGVSNPPAAASDAFVTRLNPAGSALTFSTCFGGSDIEQANGVALDGAGGIYLVGTTSSTNLPLTNAARGAYGGGRSDAFVAKFGPGVDLAVSMTDAPDPVAYGADLTYGVRVKNNGDLPATGVRLTDALPAGVTFVSAATDRGSCTGTDVVVCDLGTLAGGEEANVTLKVKPPAARTFSNTATVTLNEADAVAANNSATAETTVDFADLAVTKSPLTGTVAPGSKVVFLLTVTNKSGAAAGSVTISDVLPPELTFVSCDAPRGVCAGAGNSRTVTFASLAVGATEGANIVATVNPSVPGGTVLNNTATAASSLPDPFASDNSASASVTVGATAVAARSNGKIAFTTGEAPTTRLNVVNQDGTGLAPLTPGQEYERKAAWSPDGSKLAYRNSTRLGGGPWTENIVVANADGTGARVVASDAAPDTRPTWSPAGDYIAYLAWQQGTTNFSLKVAGPAGSGGARLLGNMEFVSGIDWSPDGSKFAFTKQGALWVMDVDGSNRQQLTTPQQTSDGLTSDSSPDWSPDGATILFTRSTNNGRDAYTVNADGTGLSRLLNVTQMGGASWSPDGLRVVYALGNDIYVADVDGARLPSKVAGAGFDPAWQPLPNANPTPTPTPAQTYTISGRVAKPDGSRGSALVKLSGARTATAGTDQNGNYSFVRLPRGGSYTVTPTSGFSTQFVTYTPGSRTVGDLQGDVTGLDFVETNSTRTLKGRVVTAQGQPMAGVTVSLFTGFGARRDTTTDADGRYSFELFAGGQGFSVTAFYQPYSFDQVRPTFDIAGDVTVNLVGTPFANARSISGRVLDEHNNPVVGLRVALGGARTAAVKTDASGNFGFVNLPTGQNYTVTPSAAEGFSFGPPRAFDNLSNDVLTVFNATTVQPFVNFVASDVSVAENARFVELTLTRTGDPSMEATVDYETSEVTASERSDYLASFGSVHFAKGEASQTLRVLITDDNLVEGERIFKVTLTGSTGARVRESNVATVHVTEDDASASAANPLDSSEFFVRQHYADFLNREPDAPGLNFWVGEIEGCGADLQCREVKRINVSAAFFLSIEFKETGYLVYRLHQAAHGAGRALRPRTFLKDTREIGRGVVVGAPGWEEQLEANKRAFIDDFVLRPEFLLPYPTTLPPGHFVDALNANTGGSLTQGERDSLAAALASGALTRAGVLRAVAENAEFSRRETNRAFVLMQYFGYLRRSPAEPPDSDFSGWQFWLDKLNEFNGNFIQAEMVKAFITSDEYRRRFARQ